MSANRRHPSCARCRVGFPSFKEQRNHYIQDRLNHPFYCIRCDEMFANKQEQIEHVKRGIEVFLEPPPGQNARCRICRAGFSGMNVLQSHLASSPEHRYSCPSCALDFHNQEAVNQHRADVHTVLRTASSSSNSTNDDIPDITWTDEEPTWTFPETLVRLPEINSTRLIQPRTQITLSDLESESEDDFEETRDLGLDPWNLRSGTLNERSYRSLQDSYASHLQRNTRQHTTAPQSNVLSRRREPTAPAPSSRIHSFAVALTNQTTQTQRSVGTAPTVTPPSNVASSSIIQEPPPRKCAFPIPCPLCLDLAVDLTSTLCGHVGCKLCLIQSLREKQECPICRKHATEKQLHPIFL